MFEKEPPISLLANALPLLVNSNVQSNILMLLEWAVPNSLTKTFVCRLEGRWNQYRFYFWLLSAASKLCTVQLDCLCSCLSLLTFIYLFFLNLLWHQWVSMSSHKSPTCMMVLLHWQWWGNPAMTMMALGGFSANPSHVLCCSVFWSSWVVILISMSYTLDCISELSV